MNYKVRIKKDKAIELYRKKEIKKIMLKFDRILQKSLFQKVVIGGSYEYTNRIHTGY